MEIQRKFLMGFRVPQRSKTCSWVLKKLHHHPQTILEFQSHRAAAVNFGRTKSTKPTVLAAVKRGSRWKKSNLFHSLVLLGGVLLIFLGVMVPRISPKSTVYAYVHFLHPRIANIRKPSIERWLKLAIEWPLEKHEQKITCEKKMSIAIWRSSTDKKCPTSLLVKSKFGHLEGISQDEIAACWHAVSIC